jgi:hypothetical protein
LGLTCTRNLRAPRSTRGNRCHHQDGCAERHCADPIHCPLPQFVVLNGWRRMLKLLQPLPTAGQKAGDDPAYMQSVGEQLTHEPVKCRLSYRPVSSGRYRTGRKPAAGTRKGHLVHRLRRRPGSVWQRRQGSWLSSSCLDLLIWPAMPCGEAEFVSSAWVKTRLQRRLFPAVCEGWAPDPRACAGWVLFDDTADRRSVETSAPTSYIGGGGFDGWSLFDRLTRTRAGGG